MHKASDQRDFRGHQEHGAACYVWRFWRPLIFVFWFNKTTGVGIIDTFLTNNIQHATPLNLMITCSIKKPIQALCAVLRSLAFRNHQEIFFSLKSCAQLTSSPHIIYQELNLLNSYTPIIKSTPGSPASDIYFNPQSLHPKRTSQRMHRSLPESAPTPEGQKVAVRRPSKQSSNREYTDLDIYVYIYV